MRRFLVFVLFAVMIMSCAEAFSFTASYEQTTSGTGMEKPQKNTVKIKDDKIRIETDVAGQKTITVIDGGSMYSYLPSQNRAIEFKGDKSRGMEVLSDYGAYLKSLDARVTGSEKVGGYDCDIYEFTDPRLKMDSKVWLWKKENFPIKVETKVPGGEITTFMENVNVGIPIDDSAFELPKGTKIISAKEAMQDEISD